METSSAASIVASYSLFRMFEYFSLKNHQAVGSQGIHAGNRKAMALFGLILLPARIAGWGLALYLIFKVGLWAAVGLLLLAFIVSLVLQITLGTVLVMILGVRSGIVFLVGGPSDGRACRLVHRDRVNKQLLANYALKQTSAAHPPSASTVPRGSARCLTLCR